MKSVTWNKLVRDHVPEIIRQDGRIPETRKLDTPEFVSALKAKLMEEAHEVWSSETPTDLLTELSDVIELVRALAQASNLPLDQLEARRIERREDRGGFDGRTLLISTTGHTLHSRLRLEPGEVRKYAKKYDQRYQGTSDQRAEGELSDWYQEHDHLDMEHFLKLCRWKSPRILKLCEGNMPETVKVATRVAKAKPDDRETLELLLQLRGVSYPVASVILHFACPERFMILDFRALWSLGWDRPSTYAFDFWMEYRETARSAAQLAGVSLRTLDKALWEYSRQHGSDAMPRSSKTQP